MRKEDCIQRDGSVRGPAWRGAVARVRNRTKVTVLVTLKNVEKVGNGELGVLKVNKMHRLD